MKKSMKYYFLCWVMLVSLFNVISFVIPEDVGGYDKYGGSFWAGYGFIMGAFAIHLAYSYYILSRDNKREQQKNAPAFVVSFISLLIIVIVGSICMIIPDLKNWVGIIICYTLLVGNIIFISAINVAEERKYAANDRLNKKMEEKRSTEN